MDLRHSETEGRKHKGIGWCHYPIPAFKMTLPLILFSEKKGRKKFRGSVPASTTGFCDFRTKGKAGESFKQSLCVPWKWHPLAVVNGILVRYSEHCFMFFGDKSARIQTPCTRIAFPSTQRYLEGGSSKCQKMSPGTSDWEVLAKHPTVMCERQRRRTGFPQVWDNTGSPAGEKMSATGPESKEFTPWLSLTKGPGHSQGSLNAGHPWRARLTYSTKAMIQIHGYHGAAVYAPGVPGRARSIQAAFTKETSLQLGPEWNGCNLHQEGMTGSWCRFVSLGVVCAPQTQQWAKHILGPAFTELVI